jgi:hypothetical protein
MAQMKFLLPLACLFAGACASYATVDPYQPESSGPDASKVIPPVPTPGGEDAGALPTSDGSTSPVSPMDASIDVAQVPVARVELSKGAGVSYKIGERIQIGVTSPVAGRLVVTDFDPLNVPSTLVPSSNTSPTVELRVNEKLLFPPPGGSYALSVGGPVGNARMVAKVYDASMKVIAEGSIAYTIAP